jgi:mono/diheme cytochrome c family protein
VSNIIADRGPPLLRKLFILAATVVGLGLAAFWLLTIPVTVSASALPPYTPNLDHGRTIFFAGGCAACHATNKDDSTKLGGGLALKTPFGTFYMPNISPDPDDGIGGWSEAQFVTALVKGSAPDGRHYYPAFPYMFYQRMPFDDVREGKVRDHDLPIHFGIRRMLGIWKLLFLDGVPFKPDPAKPADWNRGAYLVNGPGHCAECHTPRNFLGGTIQSQNFTGAPDPEGEGFVPNITQWGLKDWSVQDIAEMLYSGDTPDDKVGGSMVAVIRNTSQLSLEDRMAMAVYLKSLPIVEGAPRPAKK